MTRSASRPVLLCDADGCLFPSEDPAYDASATVTAQLLTGLGIDESYSASRLRREFVGLNFRATATELSRRHEVHLAADTLEHWVAQEREVVTRHLTEVLGPDAEVREPLSRAASSMGLAVVSSSAASRIDACLAAAGLAELFPAEHRYSAEDLDPPTSKPAPDVYLEAVRDLGVSPARALAVEDSEVGVRAASAAGITVLGLVRFVAPEERAERRSALLAAGAADVMDSWEDVVDRAVVAGRP